MARPYIITIASEKGGVGKTTLATNLAIYLKGLVEDLPITLFSFDNHFTVDQMFQLKKTNSGHHVGQLFTGVNAEDLATTGQYGVNFIPSNGQLFDYLHHIQSVEQLAISISQSTLQGLLIIDTSPILDIYTRNALFAADRVIVPIKDAPSLENCRHLADFLFQNHRPKTTLKILPCLIDTRIHFDGPFRNSYQLLKAYAINRGYRCYEGFIAKSPKVETLSTNPSGKIYPVITHARQTEVHLQLSHLARQVYLDYLEHGPERLNEVANHLFEQKEIHADQYRTRLKKIQPGCLYCGAPLPANDDIWPDMYYLENINSSYCGYIEEKCFFTLLLENYYRELKGNEQQSLLRDVLYEPTNRGYLLLQKTSLGQERAQLDLYRLDHHGEKISGRSMEVKETGYLKNRDRTKTLDLFAKAYPLHKEGTQSLLLQRTGENPFNILEHQPYLSWLTTLNRIQIDGMNENDQKSAIQEQSIPQ